MYIYIYDIYTLTHSIQKMLGTDLAPEPDRKHHGCLRLRILTPHAQILSAPTLVGIITLW